MSQLDDFIGKFYNFGVNADHFTPQMRRDIKDMFLELIPDNYPDIKIVDGVENDPTVIRACNYEFEQLRRKVEEL